MTSRTFDIVVWGATGYTGTLVAEYLASSAPATLKWAIAGRSKAKLEKLKQDLVRESPSAQNIGILIGESGDQQSVDNVVRQTRVVLNTAGPYILYGTPVVDACVRLGTDHCDLTGEPKWIKQLATKYNEQAKKNNVIILNCCGWDSVPNDLTSFLTADYVKEKYGSECESMNSIITKFEGGVSGGSLATALNAINDFSGSEEMDPYYLVPDGLKPETKQPSDQMFVSYDNDAKLWRYPYILGIGENRFVRRSQALMGYRYGNFKFSTSLGSKSFIYALFSTLSLIFMFGMLQFKIVRWIVSKLKPPGSGPSRSALPKGGYSIVVVAEPKKRDGVPRRVFGHSSAVGDPGYFLTARMISETAICLATQRDKIPARGGILTPSSCLGNLLVDRLRDVGFEFNVSERVSN